MVSGAMQNMMLSLMSVQLVICVQMQKDAGLDFTMLRRS